VRFQRIVEAFNTTFSFLPAMIYAKLDRFCRVLAAENLSSKTPAAHAAMLEEAC